MTILRFFIAFFVLTACSSSYAKNYNLRIDHALDDEMAKEAITVFVDGEAVGVLETGKEQPTATLTLTLNQPLHHYRFAGEVVNTAGKSLKVQGAGVIATLEYMNVFTEGLENSAEILAGYEALISEIATASPEVDLSDFKPVVGQKYTPEMIADAETRLGVKLPEDYKIFVQEVGSLRFGEAARFMVRTS